ncbi:chemosensory receptor a [Plakobranchus ocellatus]|uniref:Chemosensory receptor a n=1 Tax=Plakobranchus ocellatus TaxID=259542 RepID=A0AAV4D302_9GAST|nr:chemosensory receptor a [Plakobranchus ocellatus]
MATSHTSLAPQVGQGVGHTQAIPVTSAPISPIVSDEVRHILFTILVQVGQLVIASFGILSNVVNIIVYFKMGFSETSSVTLTALALTDLLTEIWLVLMAASLQSHYTGAQVTPLSVTIMYLLSTASNAVLGYGSWITAIISTERCLCIVFPLKVKSIFTVRRITMLLTVVLIIQLVSIIPTYATIELTYVQSPLTNRSTLVLARSEYSLYVETITMFALFTIPSVICFSIVVICTIFLVVKLNQSAKWRQSTSNATQGQEGTMSTKENRVVRTVVLICAIYIFCFAPNVLTVTTMAAYPDFNETDPYLGNLLSVCFIIAFPCHAICSAVNIFVYLGMSTKYRETFVKLFCPKKKKLNGALDKKP